MKTTFAIAFVLVVSCTMISCKKKENKLEIHLTDKTKRWVYIDNEKDNPKSILMAYIGFEKDKKCQNFSVRDNSEIGNEGTWDYSPKDSSLIVIERKFKVLKVLNDTIVVKYQDENFKALFINFATKIQKNQADNKKANR